jgi:hypothetical protein
MKAKIMYSTVIILVITLSILLYVKDEEELVIISSDSIYSIYHSDVYESFTIEILTNQPQNYYFDNNYLSSASLKNDNQDLSIDITKITHSDNSIYYQEDEFYNLYLTAELSISSDDLLISMDNVFLHLNYMNGEEIVISIGEFNYLFYDSFSSDISLNNLSATHQEVNEINTISGINLELGNLSDSNILITNIGIVSNNVSFNLGYSFIRDECFHTSTVDTCLNVNDYQFNQESNILETNFILRKNNVINLYLPLTYLNNSKFIYRFSIVVTYEINNTEKTFIIDDFPYMKTSLFSDQLEGDFNVYTYTN